MRIKIYAIEHAKIIGAGVIHVGGELKQAVDGRQMDETSY